MRFVLENINKIRKADILLNGLTVITGENDSGKSTIGKLLFSTIKALANTNMPSSKRQALVEKHINSLYKRLQSKGINRFSPEMKTLFPLSIRNFVQELNDATALDILEDYLQKRIAAIEQLDTITPRLKKLMLEDVANIRICLTLSDNQAASIKTEIQYFIESEFMNKLCSYNTDHSTVELDMDEEGKNRLSYTLTHDFVNQVNIHASEFLQDATYVESPLYLHLVDSLLYASAFRETDRRMPLRPMVPIHIKDLIEKIDSMKYLSSSRPHNNINIHLEDIVKGRFDFDKSSRALRFTCEGANYAPINVASGIKSFGVIQMLLDTGSINENRILIWDEPENHLHPQWQIEFAKVLVALANAGIPVVISTHSPYFIQGIRYFAARHKMEQFVNYYLGEKEKGGLSVFKNVTDDLNLIFLKLAKPLNDYINCRNFDTLLRNL